MFSHKLVATLALVSLALVACTKKQEPEPVVKTEETIQLEQQADAGDKEAQYTVGGMYYKGEGEPLDTAKAMEYFLKAADQGLDNAQYTMGFMEDKGEVTAKNPLGAIEWFRKAAEQGHEESIYRLGLALSATDAVIPRDDVQAYAWLSLIADGDTRAAAQLRAVAARMTSVQMEEARAAAEEVKKRMEAEEQQ